MEHYEEKAVQDARRALAKIRRYVGTCAADNGGEYGTRELVGLVETQASIAWNRIEALIKGIEGRDA